MSVGKGCSKQLGAAGRVGWWTVHRLMCLLLLLRLVAEDVSVGEVGFRKRG